MIVKMMMRMILVLGISGLALAAGARTGDTTAKNVPPTRREIQAVYNQIDAALAQKNVDAVADFDTDDCEYYNIKGKRMEEGSGRQGLVDLLEYIRPLA